MFNFIFKNTAYFLFYNKFRFQIISLILSIGIIFGINSIYNDLILILNDLDERELFYIFLGKWFSIVFIIALELYVLFYKGKDEQKKEQSSTVKNSTNEKIDIKHPTTTDIILNKYIEKKQEEMN